MGQAFRRASGRIRASSKVDTTPLSKPKRAPPPQTKVDVSKTAAQGEDTLNVDGGPSPRVKFDNMLEERDPKYDAMLGQMIGRVTSKPGGKPEMGEAFVVEKYNRPMPKLRNTKPDSGRNEEKPVPTGTLNVAQLRHVFLLHEGKAEDHKGAMDLHQIAQTFRIDVVHIQRILQFLSLPPEGTGNQDNKGRGSSR